MAHEITLSERANYVLDMAVVSVMANAWEIESGELGTVESIRSEAAAKLRDYFQNKVFTALSTVWTAANTPDNFTNVGGSLSQTALENAIQQINNTTSGAKAIVGARSALQPLMKFGPFWSNTGGANTTASQTYIDEVIRTGWLGQYLGVPVIALGQQYDNPEDYNELIPTDKVLVIGEKVGEFITYGPARPNEWTDNKPIPPYWHYDLAQQWGMIVDKAQGIYVIGGIA